MKMKKRSSLWIVLPIVAVVVLVVVVAVGRRVAARRASATDEASTVVVTRGTLEVTVTASGRIEAVRQVDLSFDVPGQVSEVNVRLGDAVSAGQVLARLDSGDLARAVAQAEIGLQSAQLRLERLQRPADEAAIRQAEDSVTQAAAALRVAQLNMTSVLSSTLLNEQLENAQYFLQDAQTQYAARLAEYEEGRIGDWMLDRARQTLETAQLNLARTQQQADLQLQSARNQVTQAAQAYGQAQDRLEQLREGSDELDRQAAQLDIDNARLALERAQSQLASATLTAPFDGVIAAVNLVVGEAAPTMQPAVTLLDPAHLQITVGVDELDVARLSVGLPVEVTVDALPDARLTGRVERIAPAASVDLGAVSYPVIIALDPTDAPVRVGMSATAVIMVEELADQLLIPNWVVRIDQTTGQPFVYRRTAGGNERVDVQLGVRYGGYSQVLAGLAEGDVLVLVRETGNGFFGQP